jgi:uncharacterized protein (TIGR00661 family)
MELPPNFPKGKKVLVCVLNWGLGHATRSMVVIDELIKLKNQVIIASDGEALVLLKNKYLDVEFFPLKGYGVTYPSENIFINFLLNSFNIYRAVQAEKKAIKRLDEQVKFDVVISDNRPGCILENKPSYFISHQLKPYHPSQLLSNFFQKLNDFYIQKFSEIWVPDYKNNRLSGKLSSVETAVINPIFIGPLSIYEKSNEKQKDQVTIILSGPEPQRSILENIVLNQLSQLKSDQKIVLIRGTKVPSKDRISLQHLDVKVLDLCNQSDMNDHLNRSSKVISRTGYTTIMDLDKLDIKRALLIPTPGQTEQEYLGILHQQRWTVISQNELRAMPPRFMGNWINEC